MKRKLSVFLLALAVLLTACGGGGGSQGELVIEDAWVRPSPMMAGNGAGYMVIINRSGQDDALIGAEADFADRVEVHETVMMEDDMMGMHAVERIDIPSGGRATLEPGGYHVMLIGIRDELRAGDTVTLTLVFEKAGSITVEAPVKEQ